MIIAILIFWLSGRVYALQMEANSLSPTMQMTPMCALP